MYLAPGKNHTRMQKWTIRTYLAQGGLIQKGKLMKTKNKELYENELKLTTNVYTNAANNFQMRLKMLMLTLQT